MRMKQFKRRKKMEDQMKTTIKLSANKQQQQPKRQQNKNGQSDLFPTEFYVNQCVFLWVYWVYCYCVLKSTIVSPWIGKMVVCKRTWSAGEWELRNIQNKYSINIEFRHSA